MSAHYTIDVEPSRDLIRIQLSGFFTEADFAGLLAARSAAHAQLNCRPNQHVTLTDVRDMKIQAQEMVEAFRAMIADPSYRAKRLAFVVSPTLARSQLVRAVGARDAHFFEDMGEAEAWLRTGIERDRAA
ncbi:hypothetical protein AB2M62_15985 [Sphingomonas sp. MMS12-HWE2-04]|uniref:hypothetical protein n=1 Tax=Sphingomonas sp. MMS12-HWE2-04 TaxID=3234199 RepID=UPI00384F35FD